MTIGKVSCSVRYFLALPQHASYDQRAGSMFAKLHFAQNKFDCFDNTKLSRS